VGISAEIAAAVKILLSRSTKLPTEFSASLLQNTASNLT
jgi:hypothetical protein